MHLDYKKIIQTAEARHRILNMLQFIPDSSMVKFQYWIKTGRHLNLSDPKRYTEKLQWYKLNYRDPVFARCVDKYEVRGYLEEQGFSDLLNKCYGVFDRFEDIDFDALPDQFVLKDTLGGGGMDVIVCKNKAGFDFADAKKRCDSWVARKCIPSDGREWPYYSGKSHRILVEKYLADLEGNLTDYKFFCFDGTVRFSYFRSTFVKNHHFLDENDNPIPVKMDYGVQVTDYPDLPPEYKKMKHISEALSAAFPHVRVDLYDVDGKIIFGELTFYHTSGYCIFDPDEYDYIFGDFFHLPEKI